MRGSWTSVPRQRFAPAIRFERVLSMSALAPKYRDRQSVKEWHTPSSGKSGEAEVSQAQNLPLKMKTDSETGNSPALRATQRRRRR